MFSIKNEELNGMLKEEALEQLKKSVSIRNQMGGAMYWNILNDECCEIANKCFLLGVDRSEITPLLGEGNYR
ncbi:TPA: hypothetical protein LA742_000736 [Clostridium botulinum]|nr:hypothetical protein [Clostridium botulinum]